MRELGKIGLTQLGHIIFLWCEAGHTQSRTGREEVSEKMIAEDVWSPWRIDRGEFKLVRTEFLAVSHTRVWH